MELSMEFINTLYIGREILDNDRLLIKSVYKIFKMIKNSKEYKSYISYLDEQSRILSHGPIEELHYCKLSEVDILSAIISKELLENDITAVSILKIEEIFNRLLLSQAFTVYPISEINHKMLHNALYGDNDKTAEDILKDFNIPPLGNNLEFFKEYISYIPQSVIDKFDIPDNTPKINTIITFKNEDGGVLYEGKNTITTDKVDLNGIIFNIGSEDVRELFNVDNPNVGLYSNDIIKIIDSNKEPKTNRDGGLTGAVIPFPIGFINASDIDNFISLCEGRKALVVNKLKDTENKQIMSLKFLPGNVSYGFEQGISEERKNKLFNILSIKRNIELNMRVTGHTVDEDDIIVFNIDLGKNIEGKETNINKLTLITYEPLDFHFESFNLDNGSYFDIDDFTELKFIFETEQNMYESIRPYTIKYLKDNNLPRWYLSECEIAERVHDTLAENPKGGEYVFESDVCKSGVDTNYSFNIEVGADDNMYMRLYNNIADVTINGTDYDSTITQFVKEWNDNVKEKYDWSIYNDDIYESPKDKDLK